MTLEDGTPILPNATLFLALPDYLVAGGDDFAMFVTEEKIVDSNSGPDQFTLVEEAIRKMGTVSPVVDGRIKGA